MKRISRWPDGALTQSGLYFMHGDNAPASQDSRHFGGIPSTKIAGKVKLVLLGVDQKQHPVNDSYLKRVQ